MSGTGDDLRVEAGAAIDFDRLYELYFDRIFHYVLFRVSDVMEAQDLTSQVFFKALRGLWRFRWRGGSVGAWLYRIATNEVNSHFRRQRVARAFVDRERTDASASDSPETADAEAILARHRVYLELSRALRDLRPDEQALIVLRYFQDKSFTEIAEIFRKREGTVTMRTHRALRKLREELEKRGIDHEGFRESVAGAAEAADPGCGIQAKFAR